jgi:hypothetical protein
MVKVLILFESRKKPEVGRPKPEVDCAKEKLLFIISLFEEIIRYLII